LNKDAGLVKVTKNGFFTGSRTFFVNGNSINNERIALIPKVITGNFSASAGGNANLSGGGTIKFTGSSIINSLTGAAYGGDVQVSSFYLDPTDVNFNNYMPGNLIGLDKDNKQKMMQSFGMISIELNDGAGGVFQLAGGKAATISLPIPSTMQNAPATIPLFYFDETKGIWKEEGTATRQGNNYVGNVSHFSFWTAGQLIQSVRLDASFREQNGNALANRLVTITSNTYGPGTGYTDSAGSVSGLIPANEPLVIKIADLCGGTIYGESIGPFSNDVNLGSITVNDSSSLTMTISGAVVNCVNSAVTNGYVLVNIGTEHYNAPIVNGNFSITITRCNYLINSDSIVAYDLTTKQQSKPQSLGGSIIIGDIGTITVCSSLATPSADFSFAATGNIAPVSISFTNKSMNATSYIWDFGDGSSSTLVNPVHIYITKGLYAVKLTANGNGGTNSISKNIQIDAQDSSHIYFDMNGTTYSWVYPDSCSGQHVDTTGGAGNETLIQAQNQNGLYMYIINDNASTGTYNATLSANINGRSYPGNAITTTITEYGSVGGYISGTATGQIKELDSTTNIPFSVSYRVKRLH